jgi:HAAS domain-containing protein
MTTSTTPEDVRSYLSAVRARLDDLPAEERDHLLTDIEPSVLESAEESDVPVELRLGPPDRFADELRAAAGLAPRAGAVPSAPPRRTLRQSVAEVDRWFSSSPGARWLRELAPLWWVLRGYVAVGLVASAYDVGFGTRYVGVPVFGGSDVRTGAVAVAVAVIVSIAIGLRRPRRNALVVLVNLLLILATPSVVINALEAGRAAVFNDGIVTEPTPPAGVSLNGAPVQNIYGFDRKGRLLPDVRLYDQSGQPLDIGAGAADSDRRPVEDRAGNVASNAFPIRYFEPGTKRVADPDAGAPASPGPLAGKPLQP